MKMKKAQELFQSIIASTKELAASDTSSPNIQDVVNTLASATDDLHKLASDMDIDFKTVCEQTEKLHAAAIVPAQRYRRVATITNKLRGLVKVASLPQNAAVRPQIIDIVRKTAGIFSEIDTVEDLDKPLEQIEKAVEKLYGDQNKSSSYDFGNYSKSSK